MAKGAIMKKELYRIDESKRFYESRYDNGYMDEWPIVKIQRVYELIKSLSLPQKGIALDFGCGNGIFTDIIRQALPEWKIYGCDISMNAINHAKRRFSECTFFVIDNDKPNELKFDFLFTHHVLEHVFDLNVVSQEINALMNQKASMLHILPCGNAGSFEYNVVKLRVDGINKEMENRFFYEDEGHLRRLTTDQMNEIMMKYSFELRKDFYSNHYYGAIKWISQSTPAFILEFANPKMAKDTKGFVYTFILRFRLLSLYVLQLPAIVSKNIRLIKHKKLKHYIIRLLNFPSLLFSYPIFYLVNARANREWANKNHLKYGSEMYLYYYRDNY